MVPKIMVVLISRLEGAYMLINESDRGSPALSMLSRLVRLAKQLKAVSEHLQGA